VVTLRCTRALLARLGQRPDGEAPASTTRLGDWYGHLVRLGSTQLLIFISEHTRLPVLLPARNARAEVATTLADAVERTLRSLGIPDGAVADERARMSEVCFATTRSPSLLGTINDYIFNLRASHALDPSRSLEAKAGDLAEMPLLKLAGMSARALTVERFEGTDGRQPTTLSPSRPPAAGSAAPRPAADVPVEVRDQLDRWARRWLQRFLPMLLPPPPGHPFNYPVAVFGEWTDGCYFLCARYRAGQRPHEEFVVQQTRLTPQGFGRFDLAYRRPNDQWATLYRSLTAAECQRRIEADERFWPIV
jgi:hypothetical protein